MLHAVQNSVTEVTFSSDRRYDNPFRDIELNVTFAGPNDQEWVVPAFWAGEGVWKVRFAAPQPGTYQYTTVCTDPRNAGLRGRTDRIEVAGYTGSHPLLSHGRLQVSENRRYLEHADGTPFFWLADTWWMALCHRLRWPEDVQLLTADRVKKGFSVIQIVGGLYPDMPAFDPRGANEAGYPLNEDYDTINPAYFDMADLRLAHLVQAGLVPCLVACWGYFLSWMGVDNTKAFWRYLIARYGAYPMVWCLAGEATMPYYLSETREADEQAQRQGWTEVAAYVRQIDPYHNPLTIHPTQYGREQVDDPSLLDLDMLQTGHSGTDSIPNTVQSVVESLEREPQMPVFVSEFSYEGILGRSWEDIQRMGFWMSVLSGSAGHTYGANGLWQVNNRSQPFGPSPHGQSWGDTPWDEAAQLPGSSQLGLGKRLLERFRWWEMRPHPEWVTPASSAEHCFHPYVAGIPGELRVIYLPGVPTTRDLPLIQDIEGEVSYTALYFNPRDGTEVPLGAVRPDADGSWQPPPIPVRHDWILALTAS
ncbi:MAG: hypothetical protein CL878_12850 [Dehalococcoidia bacterium]|nr:hypothetical protein [Dehalococcoidia bacterium]